MCMQLQVFKLPSNASRTIDLDTEYSSHSSDVHYLSVASTYMSRWDVCAACTHARCPL